MVADRKGWRERIPVADPNCTRDGDEGKKKKKRVFNRLKMHSMICIRMKTHLSVFIRMKIHSLVLIRTTILFVVLKTIESFGSA